MEKIHGVSRKKLKEYGVVDLEKNKWMYERWYTSDWPDDSNWGLTSDGEKIRVAHYGAYSGQTGPDGITAELILYDFRRPPESIKDKIVVITSRARAPMDSSRLCVNGHNGSLLDN